MYLSHCPFVARDAKLLSRPIVAKFVGDSRLRQLHYSLMEYLNFARPPKLDHLEVMTAVGVSEHRDVKDWYFEESIWSGKFNTQMSHLCPTSNVRHALINIVQKTPIITFRYPFIWRGILFLT